MEEAADSKAARIQKLRLELKEWERAFAKAHDGRKPTREETKAEKGIAAKYKEYHKLREATAAITSHSRSKSKSTGDHESPPQPSKPVSASLVSPKRGNPLAPAGTLTPSKRTGDAPWKNEVYDTPLSLRRQRIFGKRDTIGPTPQKSGRVLGIFDSFNDMERSPSKSTRKPSAVAGTPTKKRDNGDRISASPSSGRKGGGSFSTPRKRKLEDMQHDLPSRQLLQDDPFATPTALRTWPAPAGAGGESPPVRQPPARPKRGLSSMLAELREMEQHALDDEEEAMREMEGGTEGGGGPNPPKKAPKHGVFDEAELPPPPPGAFVEEGLAEEDDEKDGQQPTRVWKKKGLKRQHRRVIMRPVVTKHKASTADKEDDEQSVPSEIEDAGEERGDDDDSSHTGSDYVASGKNEDGSPKKKAKREPGQDVAAAKSSKEGILAKGKEVVKKAARKISANAQSRMNFRKLNIKNKNSKGKGRFGRRR